MLPTINTQGDWVVVNKLFGNRFKSLKTGDIVISTSPLDPGRLVIKRIAGMEQDIVDLGLVKKKVPKGHLWLSGDNPSGSTDSRNYGAVPMAMIVGKELKYSSSKHKFLIDGIGRSFSLEEQIELIEQLEFFGLKGPISLNEPKEVFAMYLDYGPLFVEVPIDDSTNIEANVISVNKNEKGKKKNKFTMISTKTSRPDIEKFRKMYFGRKILSAKTSRSLLNKYNLKKRTYLGNTSMEAEMSLVAANMALAEPGKLIYDPFVGTGSFLLVCSEFGAYTFGSDIDGRQIRGTAGFRTGLGGIEANVSSYKLSNYVLGNFISDVTHLPLRNSEFLDAIVTDPPYGVRAGAKKLGRKKGNAPTKSLQLIDGVPNHSREDYYPPTINYEMSDVIVDLLDLAAKYLVVGGRLVFWLPTVTEEYQDTDIPHHPQLKLIANSEQSFGSWTRRLITMEKIVPRTSAAIDSDNIHRENLESIKLGSEIGNLSISNSKASSQEPAHKNFREKYFSKFETPSPKENE
ncbi:hypothetical protein BB558_002377 [Smittium angustum]|uniref:tRNA (guanine(10)-N(2))-methyltransferase n=1 Tax=Smittium angustum TaxID=133377 RepID=A0A2U1J8W9_SMIAN|nr:hypothetical protein BB558_002377 [Smittium angustum]